MPAYSKIIALISGLFLVATVIMLSLGMFDFGGDATLPQEEDTDIVTPVTTPPATSTPSSVPSPTPSRSADITTPPADGEQNDDSPSETPTATTPTPPAKPQSIKVWSNLGGDGHLYAGENGIMSSLTGNDKTLVLYANIPEGDRIEGELVEWSSSKESAFTVKGHSEIDSNGNFTADFTALAVCSNEVITIKYGSGFEHKFKVWVRATHATQPPESSDGGTNDAD